MADKFDFTDKTVWVPGANGMVGSAITRRLSNEGIQTITTTRNDLDLLNSSHVEAFYHKPKPDVVILAAAKVGGIHANTEYPADFISENLQIQQNVITGAYRASVKKLLF